MPWTFVFRADGTAPPHPRFGEADEKLLVREPVWFAGEGKTANRRVISNRTGETSRNT